MVRSSLFLNHIRDVRFRQSGGPEDLGDGGQADLMDDRNCQEFEVIW